MIHSSLRERYSRIAVDFLVASNTVYHSKCKSFCNFIFHKADSYLNSFFNILYIWSEISLQFQCSAMFFAYQEVRLPPQEDSIIGCSIPLNFLTRYGPLMESSILNYFLFV